MNVILKKKKLKKSCSNNDVANVQQKKGGANVDSHYNACLYIIRCTQSTCANSL